jgi:ribosomal protein L29
MDEMLDPEMARLRSMRVEDLIDGLVELDREAFEWARYKTVLREKMAAAGTDKLSDLIRIEFERRHRL